MSGLPRWLSGKESACQCRRQRRRGFDPWVRKIPLEEKLATHSSVLAWEMLQTEEPGGLQSMGNATDRGAWWATVHGKCYRQRSLVGYSPWEMLQTEEYSPWDCKDSDTAEATEHTCRHLLEKHTLLLYVWAFIPFTLIMLWHVPHSVFLSLHTFFLRTIYVLVL